MNMNLEPGHCWLSGEPCFEIVGKYAPDHPLAGHVRTIGAAMEEAYCITLLLVDGTFTHITIHRDFIGEVKNNLNKIWRAIMQRTEWEWQNKKAMGIRHTEDQEKYALKQMSKITNNPPVGILGIERWLDRI